MTTRQAVQKIQSRRESALAAADRDTALALRDDAYRETLVARTALLRNLDISDEECDKRTKALDAALAARAAALGLHPQPRFSCPLCHDTAYTDGALCDCVRRLVAAAHTREGGLLAELPTFETTSMAVFGAARRDMETLYTRIKGLAAAFPDVASTRFLLLGGKTGTGKTHLAKCLCAALIARGFSVIALTAFRLNAAFLKIHTGKQADETSMDALLDCDVLLLDDLGGEQIYNKVTIEYLTVLIDERNLKNKLTVITTNLAPDEILARYGERFFSRLFHKKHTAALTATGADLRQKK
ncbi:MAG: ATP-binding protein [Clostridiales bacterium]|jgi:DNA replication protein DnaC|nr:ATP-binding protein [Clostridiales bacterium]